MFTTNIVSARASNPYESGGLVCFSNNVSLPNLSSFADPLIQNANSGRPYMGPPERTLAKKQELKSRLESLKISSARSEQSNSPDPKLVSKMSCVSSLAIGTLLAAVTQSRLPLVASAWGCLDQVQATSDQEKLKEMAKGFMEHSAEIVGGVWKSVALPLKVFSIAEHQQACINEGHNEFTCAIGSIVADSSVMIAGEGALAAIDVIFMAPLGVGLVATGALEVPMMVAGAAGLIVVAPEVADRVAKAITETLESAPEKVIDASIKYGKWLTTPEMQLMKLAMEGRQLYVKKAQEIADFKRSKNLASKSGDQNSNKAQANLAHKKQTIAMQKQISVARQKKMALEELKAQVSMAEKAKNLAIQAYNNALLQFNNDVKECLRLFEQPAGHPVIQPLQNLQRQWVYNNGCFLGGVQMSLNQVKQVREAVSIAQANKDRAIQNWNSLVQRLKSIR